MLLYNKLFIFSFIKTVHSIHKQGGRRNKKTHFSGGFFKFKNRWVGSKFNTDGNKYNPYKNRSWKGEKRYINQSKFRAFRHATQHLNFLHLKTKPGALIGVQKESYKSIAKMLALHIPHIQKERN